MQFVIQAQNAPTFVYPNRTEAAAFLKWLTHYYWDSIGGQNIISDRIGSPHGNVFMKNPEYTWWGQLADKFDSVEIAHFLMQIDSLNHNLGIPDTTIDIDHTALDTMTAEEIFSMGVKLAGWNGAYATNPIYPEKWTHEFIDDAIMICAESKESWNANKCSYTQEISYPIFSLNRNCAIITFQPNYCILQTLVFRKQGESWVLLFDTN